MQKLIKMSFKKKFITQFHSNVKLVNFKNFFFFWFLYLTFKNRIFFFYIIYRSLILNTELFLAPVMGFFFLISLTCVYFNFFFVWNKIIQIVVWRKIFQKIVCDTFSIMLLSTMLLVMQYKNEHVTYSFENSKKMWKYKSAKMPI